jgi:hypothetical protein
LRQESQARSSISRGKGKKSDKQTSPVVELLPTTCFSRACLFYLPVVPTSTGQKKKKKKLQEKKLLPNIKHTPIFQKSKSSKRKKK